MNDFAAGISSIRDSVASVLKITRESSTSDAATAALPTFGVAFVGTAWCVVANRYFVTAHHIFNNVGSSRVDLQACKLEYSIVSPK